MSHHADRDDDRFDEQGNTRLTGSNTWSAVVSGGTLPYTFQWSGVLSGTGATVGGALYSNGYLFLDVWDSAGHHAALSVYVYVNPCPGNVESC